MATDFRMHCHPALGSQHHGLAGDWLERASESENQQLPDLGARPFASNVPPAQRGRKWDVY